MPKFIHDSSDISISTSGNFSFSQLWIPKSTLHSAASGTAGVLVFTSGALFVCSGNGQNIWHKFTLGDTP